MNNLERDIQASHSHITEWLSLYEKTSEQIISLSYTTQMHVILDAIATFQPEKLKEVQAQSKDEIVLKHLGNISSKIKTLAQPKTAPSTPAPVVEQPKRESRIAEKPQGGQEKGGEKKGGFMESVWKRFASKQKKASEIILPDKQPNCYFDPERRVWVFEGEEPELPKVIAKPPSKSEIVVKSEEPRREGTEMENLTAPPTFKRKGNSATGTKGRSKKEVQVAETGQQPFVFAKLLERINGEYEGLLEKVRGGQYERPVPELHTHGEGELSQFVRLAQTVLESAGEVGACEQRLMEKLNRGAGEGSELRLLERVLREITQSANIYQHVSVKLDECREGAGRSFRLEKQESRLSVSVSEEAERYAAERNQLMTEIGMLQADLQRTSKRLSQKLQQNETLSLDNQKLSRDIDRLNASFEQMSQQNSQTDQKLERSYQKEQELRKTNEQLSAQVKAYSSQIQTLRRECQGLLQQKNEAQRRVRIVEAGVSSARERVGEEVQLQKAKVQSQLRYYEQKQKSFLRSLKSMQEHGSFIHEFEQTLNQQNQLLNSILQKRLQISRSGEGEQAGCRLRGEEGGSPQRVILELSDIITSITQTHLDRLDCFNRNYAALSRKYHEARELNKKIKHSASTEYMSLNRSVSRLKSLIESYKLAKEEAEEKNLQLELECEKLRKRLEHYKEEDRFNKSYLTRFKAARPSQNDSVVSLQEDNEELAETIQDLQKEVDRKEQNCSKLQTDLDDILANYQKTQAKHLQLERRAKDNEREVRTLREEKADLLNRITLLEARAANQKEKYEELAHREAAKTRTAEASWEKKLGILREELQQGRLAEEEARRELEEASSQHRARLEQTEAAHRQRVAQLAADLGGREQELARREEENAQILLLLEEATQKEEVQAKTIAGLQATNRKLQLEVQRLQQANLELQRANDQLAGTCEQLISCRQGLKRANEELTRRNYELQVSSGELVKANDQLQQRNSELALVQVSLKEEHAAEVVFLREQQNMHNSMISEILQSYRSFKLQEFDFREDYQSKISCLQEKLVQSDQQSHQLLASIDQYAKVVAAMEAALLRLQQQHDLAQRQQRRLRELDIAQVRKMQIQGCRLEEQLVCVQDALETKKQEVGELEILTQSLSAQVQQLKTTLASLSAQNQNIHSELALTKRDLAHRIGEIDDRRKDVGHREQEIQRLLMEIQSLERMKIVPVSEEQLQRLKSELQQKDLLIEDLRNDLEQLVSAAPDKEDGERLSQKIVELQTINLDLRGEIKDLNDTVLKKEVQITELTEALENCSKDLMVLQIQMENVKTLQLQKQTLTAQNQDLRGANSMLQKQNQALKAEKQYRKEDIDQTALSINNLEKQLCQIKVTVQQKQRVNLLLRQQLKESQESITVLQKQIEDLQHQLQLLKEERAGYQRQISLLKQCGKEQNNIQDQQRCIDNGNSEDGNKHIKNQVGVEERTDRKEVDEQTDRKEADIESGMQFLLKEIEDRDNENSSLKDQLKRQVNNIQELKLKIGDLQSQNGEILENIDQLQTALSAKEQAILENNTLVQTLKNQKDQLVNIISNLSKEIEALQQTTTTANHRGVAQTRLQYQLLTKTKIITDLQIANQETERLLNRAHQEIAQKDQEITEKEQELAEKAALIKQLQNKALQLSQIIQSQEQAIEKSRQQQSNDDGNQLKETIQRREAELVEVKRKLQELTKQFSLKESEYQGKIQSLQRQIISLNSLKTANKKLEDQFKSLEAENASLLNEKVQLMRSNDNLMKINEKLIIQISPHNKHNFKAQPKTVQKQKVQQAQSLIQPVQSEPPKEAKDAVTKSEILEPKAQKPESKGFLGTLSSFFLTPTESERMVVRK